MYIFFSCPFIVTVLNSQFDPKFPFNGFPLHAIHPPYPSLLPPPSPSTETDPSEDSSYSSSFGGDQEVLDLTPKGFSTMENGFYTPMMEIEQLP